MDNVIKQGYLKKAYPMPPCQTSANLATSIKQLFEPVRWYVFGMKQGTPILEYYEKEESVFTSQPLNTVDLTTCERISYTLGKTNKNWTFCLFLEDRILELSADSREHMLAWCRLLERTLHEHGRLKKYESDHVYSEYPMKKPPKKNRTPSPPSTQAPPPPLPPDRNSRPLNATAAAAANHSASSEEIFSDQASLMHNIRQSVNVQNNKSLLSEASGGIDVKESSPAPKTRKKKRPIVVVDVEESSEPDTTGEDDFLPKEFWLSNKIHVDKPPPIPLRSDSMKPSRKTASYGEGRRGSKDDLVPFRFSVPPLPRRPQSMIVYRTSSFDNGANGIDDDEDDVDDDETPRPRPPPRKVNQKKGEREAKSKQQDQSSVSSEEMSKPFDESFKLSRDNQYSFVRNIEDPLDSFSKTEESTDDNDSHDDVSSDDTSLDEEGGDSSTLTGRQRSTFPHKGEDGHDGDDDDDDYDDFQIKDENEIYELANGTVNSVQSDFPKKFQDLDDGYQAITELKNGDVDASASMRTEDNLNSYDTADFTAGLRVSLPPDVGEVMKDSSDLTPTNVTNYNFPPNANISVSTENDYAPFPGETAPNRISSGSDDMSSIPGLPVRNSKPPPSGNVNNIPEKPPRKSKVNSPNTSPVQSKSNTPKKIPQLQENSKTAVDEYEPESYYYIPPPIPKLPESKESKPPSPKIEVTQPEPESFYVAPPRKRNVPPLTEYAYVTRKSDEIKKSGSLDRRGEEEPKLPPPRRSKLERLPPPIPKNAQTIMGRNSPTHDGFQFNFTSDRNDSDDGGNEHELHTYEDATMLHERPPEPPPRNIRRGIGKSQSVYVTSSSSRSREDLETADDSDISKARVYRQPSLGERQRISQAAGSVSVIPLKQSQVELLQHQQKLHGIQVNIHTASGARIAFVDVFNAVWVAGWDMRACPRLNDKLHIGDRVLKINQMEVINTKQAHALVKQSRDDMLELTVKRLPLAKVYSVTRTVNRQPLGIKREGGTAEICYVDPNGLAAAHGLEQKVRSPDGNGQCHWWITEINSRPLNLTFKAGEMEPLLNAVGKDISFVVQPVAFIVELKKQLKKVKNYKDFLAL